MTANLNAVLPRIIHLFAIIRAKRLIVVLEAAAVLASACPELTVLHSLETLHKGSSEL
jgi:hypothetical protein